MMMMMIVIGFEKKNICFLSYCYFKFLCDQIIILSILTNLSVCIRISPNSKAFLMNYYYFE